MKVRFVAEVVDDDGNVVKSPVEVETDVPDVTEFIAIIKKTNNRQSWQTNGGNREEKRK